MTEEIFEEEGELETTTRADYVEIASMAIEAALTINAMTIEDEDRRSNILNKSLAIIDNIITEMYYELYED